MSRRLAAAAVLLAVLVLGTAAPSRAAAPRQQGWWTVAPVAGPDVPDDGLLVEGAAASPASFAALVFDVASDATVGKLTLIVAPNSATIPNVTLQVCPLTEPAMQPVQGGAMADGPEFDCSKNVTAQPGSDGTTYEFEVGPLRGDGVLALAIVGTTPTDRVVLSAPDQDSLPVEQAATTGADDNASFADAGSGATSGSGGSSIPPAPAEGFSESLSRPTASVPGGGGPAASDQASDVTRVASGVAAFDTSGLDAESAENRELLLVVLGIAVVLGGWLTIGRSAALRASAVASGGRSR